VPDELAGCRPEVFSSAPTYSDGYVNIGDEPGLGIEIDEKAAAKYPYLRRYRPLIRRADDSAWAY
jgi:mannonate dehydratase